jgi:Bacterial membrane protein YfhO
MMRLLFRWLYERRAALLVGALIVGSVLVLYGRFLVRPADFFIGDLVNLFGPLRHQYVTAVSSGELPLWSSAIFAGTPVFADPQAATFYPGTTVHLTMGYPLAELVAFLLHLILGGWGMVWLCRKLGLGWAPAALAGLSYCCSGYFITHLVHPNFVHTAAWIPWALGTLRQVVSTGRTRWMALGAVAVGLSLLAGGLQLAYYGLGAALVLAGGWAAAESSLSPKQRLARFGLVAVAVGLGLALAAIQLVPTAEFSAHSVRAHGVTLDLARSYRLPARGVLQLFVPYLYGLPGKTPYVGGQNIYEAFGYLGVAAMPLALAALGRLRVERIVLAVLVLLALWAAVGPEAPWDLHRSLYAALPGFDRFRAHGRLLYVVVLGLSILAACGLHDLLHGEAADQRRAAHLWLGFTLLAVGVAIAAWLGASGQPGLVPAATAQLARTSALVATGVVLGVWAAWTLGQRARLGPAWPAVGIIAIHLLDLLATGRTLVAHRHPPAGVDTRRRAHRLPAAVQASARTGGSDGYRVLFAPDTYYMLQNLGMVQGFDNLRAYGPMMLRRTYDLLHHADRGRFAPWKKLPVDQNLIRVGRYNAPVLRMLGVRHVLRHNRPRARPRTLVPLRYHARELPRALTRAWLVHRTELLTTTRQREARLRNFDPTRTALVERRAAKLSAPQTSDAQPSAGTDASYTPARVISRSKGGARMNLAVQSPRPGLLVIAESWYPGWKARVNGRVATVYRVNHGLMGVKVGAGKQRVALTFAPPSLTWGTALSLAALLAILMLGLWAPFFRKLSPPEEL